MLGYTEIKPGQVIILENEPYEVVWTSGVVKKQRQKPHNTAKLKNLKTGATIEKTFTQADKIEEANLQKRPLKFLYQKRDEFWFSEPDNPRNRFMLKEDIVEDKILFIRPGDVLDALVFGDEIMTIVLPIKVVLEVVESPPNVKGNTAQGGTKVCVTETGLKVTTPLFIEAGDKIVVNTQTKEYIERYKG